MIEIDKRKLRKKICGGKSIAKLNPGNVQSREDGKDDVGCTSKKSNSLLFSQQTSSVRETQK